MNAAATPFKVGEKVSHAKFGSGIVVAVNGQKVIVDFTAGDRHTLVDTFLTSRDPNRSEPPRLAIVKSRNAEAVPVLEAITATPYKWVHPSTIPLRPWVLGRWLLR